MSLVRKENEKKKMIALIIIASVIVYLVSYVIVAGAWYRELRPYTEPLSCDYTSYSHHTHIDHCYRRPGHWVDSNAEAMWYAMCVGLTGPLGILLMVLAHFIKKTDRETIEELRARTKRLEKELGMK